MAGADSKQKKAVLGFSKDRLSITQTPRIFSRARLFVRMLMGGLGVLVGVLGMFLGRYGVGLAFLVLGRLEA